MKPKQTGKKPTSQSAGKEKLLPLARTLAIVAISPTDASRDAAGGTLLVGGVGRRDETNAALFSRSGQPDVRAEGDRLLDPPRRGVLSRFCPLELVWVLANAPRDRRLQEETARMRQDWPWRATSRPLFYQHEGGGGREVSDKPAQHDRAARILSYLARVSINSELHHRVQAILAAALNEWVPGGSGGERSATLPIVLCRSQVVPSDQPPPLPSRGGAVYRYL
eukprot:scaffold551_cov395-Prasinococcus_capsulatus_cf.AAC.4